jgi:hypothetical protein
MSEISTLQVKYKKYNSILMLKHHALKMNKCV